MDFADNFMGRHIFMSGKYIRMLITVTIGAAIWFCPFPEGIKPEAWHLLAVFIATIIGFILHPFPVGAIAFLGLSCTALTGTLKITDILSGFSDPTAWLIATAFLFSRSFSKTGLGKRISFQLIKWFGGSSLRLLYMLIVSDMIIAPVTPSNTARSGGMFFPIIRSLASSYNSEPGPTAKRIGSFLIQGMFHGDNIISGLYMTAMAGNPLMAAFVAKIAGVQISWGLWLLAASVPILLAVLIIPYFLYRYDAPEIKKTPEAKAMAVRELDEMGPMKKEEKWLLGIFVAALALWASSQLTGLNATTVAIVAVSAMILSNVLIWDEVIGEKNAWDVLIWMGGLMCLAGFLSKLGLIPWIADQATLYMGDLSWPIALTLITLAYIFSHYLFASLVAHIAALFAAFYAVIIALGAPPYLAAFILIFANTSMQGLTHYSVGSAPIYFGAGYVSQAQWWKTGLIVTTLQNVIYVGSGLVWLKILGLY